MSLKFFFDKPKSANSSACWKTTKPDLNKLTRGIFDALVCRERKCTARIARVPAAAIEGRPRSRESGAIYSDGRMPP
jgi:hypothetical protein